VALPKTVQLGQVALNLPGQLFYLRRTIGLEATFQRFTASLKFRFEVAVRARRIHPGLCHHASRLFPRKSQSMCVSFFGLDKPRQNTAGFLSPHFAPAFPCASCFTKERFRRNPNSWYHAGSGISNDCCGSVSRFDPARRFPCASVHSGIVGMPSSPDFRDRTGGRG
jgi:hypothetical protein